MPEGSGVRMERDGPVAVVTIDRPERRNAVDRAAADALAGAFRDADHELRRSQATLAAGGTVARAAGFAAGQGRHGGAVPPNQGSETR
jgi:enoyl-CoA hydratase